MAIKLIIYTLFAYAMSAMGEFYWIIIDE